MDFLDIVWFDTYQSALKHLSAKTHTLKLPFDLPDNLFLVMRDSFPQENTGVGVTQPYTVRTKHLSYFRRIAKARIVGLSTWTISGGRSHPLSL